MNPVFDIDRQGLARIIARRGIAIATTPRAMIFFMKKTDIAWAAGVFDADGCLRIRRKRESGRCFYSLITDVTQSGPGPLSDDVPPIIARLHGLFGGRVQFYDNDSRTNRMPRWSWRLATRQAERFLRAIEPYMTGKSDQVKLALEYRSTALGRGEDKERMQEAYFQAISAQKHYARNENSHAVAGIRLRDDE